MMHVAIAWKGGLDVLVNNAGMVDRGYLEDAPVELWDDIMAVNLRAPFICLQEAEVDEDPRRRLDRQHRVRERLCRRPKLGPYSVSKGGLMTLTRNAASALNRYKIRVNQLNVGWTLTDGEDAVQKKGRARDRLAGRCGRDHAVRTAADAARDRAGGAFASDDSALITGGVLDMEQTPISAGGLQPWPGSVVRIRGPRLNRSAQRGERRQRRAASHRHLPSGFQGFGPRTCDQDRGLRTTDYGLREALNETVRPPSRPPVARRDPRRRAWPQFRGSEGNGTTSSTKLPLTWGREQRPLED